MFSPQTQQLYKILLSSSGPIEAKKLAEKLHIFPASLYRLTHPLEKMGLLIKSTTRPVTFTAKPLDESLSLYLLHQNDWFMQQFFDTSPEKDLVAKGEIPKSRQINLSFIQSRDELMNKSAFEIAEATKTVDLLRSGHEIPADVMLEILKAKKRNVLIRMLVQDYSEENADHVANWQKNGIVVRKTTLRHIRLMLFDAQVLYFMSYKHTDSGKDMGMKIDYPPFATILAQLFNEWWDKAVTV